MKDEKITVDPKICNGKPIIRGTRIMVKNILGMFSGGYIVAAYPELKQEDVMAALEYASEVVDGKKVILRG